MLWQRWPLWPLICSCSLHALLLVWPIALGSGKDLFPANTVRRLDVRFLNNSSQELPIQIATETPVTDVPSLDASASDAAPFQVPNQPAIALDMLNRYFSSAEVDRKAEPIDLAPLIYPEGAYLSGLSGNVILRLYISETGSIDNIDILDAVPPEIFDQAAVDAVVATRFRPAQLHARSVKSIKTIEIRFNPLIDR